MLPLDTTAARANINHKYELYREYMNFISDPELLCRIYIYYVNHRLYEHSDPLTKTLILMSTAPVQFVLCESGILPFNTSELPIFPFTDLFPEQRDRLFQMIKNIPPHNISEISSGNGGITLRSSLKFNNTEKDSFFLLDKFYIMQAFVRAIKMFSRLPDDDKNIPCKFGQIIFQRYISSISLPLATSDSIKKMIDSELGYADDATKML